jgi:hypothetical protein
MKPIVEIIAGSYRDQDCTGLQFELKQPFTTTGKTSFIAVKNDGQIPGGPKVIRINVKGPMDYQFTNGNFVVENTAMPTQATPTETDEEAITRIRERFEILHEMTKAATNGDIRAMIVSGPPGVGKSFGVEQEIEKATLMDQIAGRRLRAEVVKGSASPIGLYQTLYKFSDANCVVVFDDCDSILLDDVALNLLKGALDSGKKRKISWLSESRVLKDEGIPSSFDFKGSVIFITNLKFDKMKSQKLRDHLDALQSRCHYLDLTLDTQRDKILRIKQIAGDGVLFDGYDFSQQEQDEIIDFMDENKNCLRELSLRMALKIADLRKSFPNKWKTMANTTCVKVND